MKIKHADKKEVVSRLVDVPSKNKRFFWAREIKFLNDLLERFPDIDFWKIVTFPKKYESLLALKGEYGEKTLKKKYSEYNYVIPKVEKIKLGKKVGKDVDFKEKKNTIRKFLSE